MISGLSMAQGAPETVDNLEPFPKTRQVGNWFSSSGLMPYLGNSVYSKWNETDARFTWSPELLDGPGEYLVEVYWTYRPSRGTRVPYCIEDDDGGACVEFNQKDESLAARWHSLGQFNCRIASCEVTVSGEQGQASADAVRWTFMGTPQPDDNCVVDATQWATLPDENTAEFLIDSGVKAESSQILIEEDAGFQWIPYLVFEIPPLEDPVLFGLLRIQVSLASWTYPEDDPDWGVVLYDVSDESLLVQPFWTLEEFGIAKEDVRSGRVYGIFNVRRSPADDGRILEIPLSYDAIFDINAAAGGSFAMGIASGENRGGEGAIMKFLPPTDNGIIELVFLTHPGVRGPNACDLGP
ncbi:MAG: hypothetical protein ACR2RD_16580 [Woeseiaceae bacterium]